MSSIRQSLEDDSGFIARGGCAVVVLVLISGAYLLDVIGAASAGRSVRPEEHLLFWGTIVLSLILTLIANAGRSSAAVSRQSAQQHTQTPSATSAAQPPRPDQRSSADRPQDELLKRAAELGQEYADDVSELGDDAIAALRTELERSFGPAAVAESWAEIRPLLSVSRPEGGSSD